MNKFPSIFVSHGAPTLALADSPAGRFLDGLGTTLGTPRAIVVASAHYDAPGPRVGAAAAPRTVHDFGGFPAELYRLRYDAPGDPALAAQIVERLPASGYAAVADTQSGRDHGVWVPLLRMYRAADIPVVTLSVDTRQDAAWHLALGRALGPLRDDGVLVIGSGGFVHDLARLDFSGGPPPDWASQFADWMRARIAAGEADAATRWREDAPQPQLAHPTPEHLYPLYVAWGAGGGAPGRLLHQSWEVGSLALDAFAFDANRGSGHASA